MWQALILLSAVFKAGYDINIKRVLNKEHTTEAITLINILGLLILLPFIFRINFNQEPFILLLILLRTFIFLTGDLLFYKALRHSDLSIVTPFYNLSPIFLIFLSFFVLGEVLTFVEFGGIMLLVLGSFLLKNESTSTKDHQKFVKSKYFYYVIGALFLWSLSATTSKYVSSYINSLDLLFFTMMFASAILLLYHSLNYDGILGIYDGFKKNKSALLLSSVCYLVFAGLYYTAMTLPGTKISLIIPLLRFSVFLDILIGGSFFHEQDILKKVSASAVMLLGTIIILI